MKTSFQTLLVTLSLLTGIIHTHAQGTAFTYNGRLTQNGGVVNGNYEFSFSVYDVAVNGVPVAGPLPPTSSAVTNGLFTAAVDFGPGIFTGAPRFLAISVRPVGGGAFQLLAPRQELTSSPYAIHAASAGTAAGVANGAVVKSLNNLHDNLTLAAGANMTITPNGNTLTLAAAGAGGNIWSVSGNNAYYNAGNIGVGTTTPSSKLEIVAQDGLAITGFQPFLTLRDTNAGIALSRIQSVGGDVNLLTASYISGANPLSFLKLANNGNVGIGSATPVARLEVVGQDALRLIGYQPFLTLSDANAGYARGRIASVGGDLTLFTESYMSGANPFSFLKLANNGNVGIGSATPVAKLEVVGQDALRLIGYQPFLTLSDSAAGYTRSRIQTASGEMILAPESYLNSSDPNAYAKLFNSGNFSVKTLTIRGGADVAEPFELSQLNVAKGSVVVIDEEQTGKLKLSTRAYDTQVAGIVSGANGIEPGISLFQQGALEGGQNVALSGRVYVLADATGGAIKPGDLLTTSGTPGHAMKVSDHTRSQGAILGKAMSALKDGKGMVLVLVTLQ